MTRQGILTGGTWCLDRNLLLDNWPQENGRAHVQHSEVSGGGSACNLAVNMRKLVPELPIATIGLIGDDAEGRKLLDEADQHGIDRSRMIVAGGVTTDVTMAFVSPGGLRTHVSEFDAAHLLTPDHFDFSHITHKLFHLGLPGVHRVMDAPWQDEANGWAATLKLARASGLATNLELASLPAKELASLVRPCLAHLDYLIVNDAEIEGVAGVDGVVGDDGTNVDAVVAAARSVLAEGAMRLVAVHYPMGAAVVTRSGDVLQHPSVNVPADSIRGANGAGDAFAAGFLLGVHEDWGLRETVRLAHAAAAASLRELTTTGGVTRWHDCLDLAETWGWRNALH